MREQMENQYLEWIFDLLKGVRYANPKKYTKLLEYLFKCEFSYILKMDVNRAEDGIALRYRFGYCKGYTRDEIEECIDYGESSILEMMVALAIRCEEHIMDNPEYGDRTSKWFWIMIENLGLMEMTNDNFDQQFIDKILEIFLNRQYDPNGRGGLFVVENPPKDMRLIEIWYQLCWFLNENEI